jgi:hypothetical protein
MRILFIHLARCQDADDMTLLPLSKVRFKSTVVLPLGFQDSRIYALGIQIVDELGMIEMATLIFKNQIVLNL